MSNSPYTPQEFEAAARKAVVNISLAFIRATGGAMSRTMGIAMLSALPLMSPNLRDKPEVFLGSSVAASAIALRYIRRRQQSMREDFDEIMNLAPSQASGIVGHELRDFEKALKTGKLSFTKDDLDPKKHWVKYAASLGVGLIMPEFIPAQFILMHVADEGIKLNQITRKAVDAMKANQAPEPKQG